MYLRCVGKISKVSGASHLRLLMGVYRPIAHLIGRHFLMSAFQMEIKITLRKVSFIEFSTSAFINL